MTRSPQSDAAANGPNANDELYLLACRFERERKTSAADWLNQIEQANFRVSRALQQVALAERERDKAAEDATNYYARIGELEHERDEAREALSEIAFYLSVGMGDETTTAQQYNQRIKEGIKMLTDPIVNLWKQAGIERDEAREAWHEMRSSFERSRDEFEKLIRERDEARATIESLRDQLCADKCREKAAADGYWRNC